MSEAMLLCGEDYQGGIALDNSAGQIPSTDREMYEILCVTRGAAEYWVEDRFYKLTAGDILITPAGVMVGANLKQRGCPFERLGLWMTRRYITFLTLQDANAAYCFHSAEQNHSYLLRLPEPSFNEVRESFEQMVLAAQEEEFNSELNTKAMLSAFIVKLNRAVQQHENAVLQGDSNRLAPVLSYIHQHCTEALTVEELANRFEYSPSHLAHSFKKQMGTSLYRYVLLRRLQIGRQAMLSGVPVKEAYLKCGFGDYAGFYRAFTKEFGLSPQQYKKKNQ